MALGRSTARPSVGTGGKAGDGHEAQGGGAPSVCWAVIKEPFAPLHVLFLQPLTTHEVGPVLFPICS